jgi:hypothetical protein
MKGSNIISAIHHLKLSQEHYEDFVREYPDSAGSRLFKSYVNKIQWISTDILTHPSISEEVKVGIKKELSSDVFAVSAITEKAALLSPSQREMIEDTIDAMLAGEEVKIVDINDIS